MNTASLSFMANAKRRVIWAVDPFEEKGEARSRVIGVARSLVAQGVKLEPVHVLRPEEFEMALAFESPWVDRVTLAANRAFLQWVKDTGVDGLAPPKTVFVSRPSLTHSVMRLIQYAKQSRADGILVSTHGKRGAARLFTGSFSETLLLHSTVPVLVVGPASKDARAEKRLTRILFPTDFGRSSYITFKKIVAIAKAARSEITIFHSQNHPIRPFVETGINLIGGADFSFPEFLTKDEQKKRALADRYIALAKKSRVPVKVVFSSGHETADQAIIRQAQAGKSDLIAMAAESGAVAAAIIGSVARQVVRGAPCPVWVMHH